MIDKKKVYHISLRLLGLFKDRFVFYAQNCTVAGLNYLFEENAPIWGRLYWLILLIASGFFTYFLIIPILQLDNEINFTTDTRYLNWSTKLAAITVCEDLYIKKAQRKLEASSLFNLVDARVLAWVMGYFRLVSHRDTTSLQKDGDGGTILTSMEMTEKHLAHLKLSYGHKKYLTELMYGRGSCINDYCSPCGHTIPCDVPWRDIIEELHVKCDELIAKCEYNGIPFSCCDFFHKVDSEFGSCFAFNSLQSKNVTLEDLFYVNITTGPATLSFYVPPDTMVGFTSSEELATSSVNKVFKYRMADRNTELHYKMLEMENDPMLHEEHIADRRCRFTHEKPEGFLHKYNSYGYRACKLAEDTERVYEHCGCISPVRDIMYKDYFCKNYTGLNCLSKFQERIKLGLDVQAGPGADCVPSCVENEVFMVYLTTNLKAPPNAPGLWVVIKMISLPHMRFRRNVLRTDLDIVVSIGGIIGLFFCASLLSLVELFYLLLRKRN